MKKVYFHTLGCRVNQYDTEAMRGAFARLCFESTDKVTEANVCVVNTCSVTAESDRKCRSIIRRMRRNNPQVFMVAAGCYAQGNPQQLEAMPEVDLVVGTRQRDILPLEVLNALGMHCPDEDNLPGSDSTWLTTFAEHTRAFIKIQDGCNQMCSYCKIPFYRGKARSRLSNEVLAEIEMLSDQGYREVVLCGIQLGAFGLDTEESLPELLRRINDLKGIDRFRLSSIEPDDITEELMETIIDLPKIPPHLHLPLQSGDDGILQRMRRRYIFDDYRLLVENLRRSDEHFAISSDIMVGFPGESNEAFTNSLRAIREIEFCRLHLFRFFSKTRHQGGKLYRCGAKRAIDHRRDEIGLVADTVVDSVRRRQIGRTLSVLLEENVNKENSAVGFSENYLRVQACNINNGKESLGHLVKVHITSMDEENLIGEVC